jgi:hypothetical protein
MGAEGYLIMIKITPSLPILPWAYTFISLACWTKILIQLGPTVHFNIIIGTTFEM